jgi:hypothetical protein
MTNAVVADRNGEEALPDFRGTKTARINVDTRRSVSADALSKGIFQ